MQVYSNKLFYFADTMTEDAYAELFANRPSKFVALGYSTLLTIVFTPLVYRYILAFQKIYCLHNYQPM